MTPKITGLTGLTLKQAAERKLPPPRWVIPGFLPAGLTILAGKSQDRKSWLALYLAQCVAEQLSAFGHFDPPDEKQYVAYLSLDMWMQQVSHRAEVIMKLEPSERVFLVTADTWDIKTIQNGLCDDLEHWIDQHPTDAGLIIIDVLARVQTHKNTRNAYLTDYRDLSLLKDLAHKREVPILLIHHTKKEKCEDIRDTLLGTTGIMGAVDSMIIQARSGHAEYNTHIVVWSKYGIGMEVGLNFDPDKDPPWQYVGPLSMLKLNPSRRKILEGINKFPKAPPRELRDAINMNDSTFRGIIENMLKDDQIKKHDDGHYIANMEI